MDKPSTVLYREFVNSLQQVINNSGLPAFVVIPVVRDVLKQLEQLEEQYYQNDLRAYQDSLTRGESDDGG